MALAESWARRWEPPAAEIRTPVNFAVAHSRGRFSRFPHVDVIEREVLHAIRTGGRLIVSASVRHGKSELISKWLPAWYLGRYPDRRIILAGHEAGFAARWGRQARDILAEHSDLFRVAVNPRSGAANRWDVADHAGGMLTIGVGGSPIGWGGDLVLVDDPIKSYKDAMSWLVRQNAKEWWTGTMASRIEPGGAAILIMARWHEDDLAGFLLREGDGEWREVRLPAICDDPETDAMGRQAGEALWPERWPVKALMKRKREVSLTLGENVWMAQYQQRPLPPGGGTFPERKWGSISPYEVPTDLWWVRGWDLAASKDSGDYTATCRIAQLPDGRFVIDDVHRGQWGSHEVRERMKAVARNDPPRTMIKIPQDPGQAGKDQASQLVALMAGYDVRAEPVSGSKEVRATGLAAQQQAGNVQLVTGAWNSDWVTEFSGFPRGTNDDQVDCATIAFNELAGDPGLPGVHWL